MEYIKKILQIWAFFIVMLGLIAVIFLIGYMAFTWSLPKVELTEQMIKDAKIVTGLIVIAGFVLPLFD